MGRFEFFVTTPSRFLDALDQVIYFKWLPQQARCARSRGFGLQVRVGTCRDQNDGRCRASGGKAFHQVQPAHPGHVNVRNNAVE
jgi:hypothetical protein